MREMPDLSKETHQLYLEHQSLAIQVQDNATQMHVLTLQFQEMSDRLDQIELAIKGLVAK